MKIKYLFTILSLASLLVACAPAAVSTTAPSTAAVVAKDTETVQPGVATQTSNPATASETETKSATEATQTTAPGGNGNQVAIRGFSFDPGTIIIKVGETVTWTNKEYASHQVEANDKSFYSNSMGVGDSFSQTFLTAGTFDYHCSFHESMHGTVIVQP